MKRSQGNQLGDSKARNKEAISRQSVSGGLFGARLCQASLVGKAVGRDKAIRDKVVGGDKAVGRADARLCKKASSKKKGH